MGDPSQLKVVVAAYGTPGVIGIESLFGLGVRPSNLVLLTHAADDRNQPLVCFAQANRIRTLISPAQADTTFEIIKQHRPDVLFSLHYRKRIPGRVLQLPGCGCVNLHPSLLPAYRGCFSAPWAIINGESVTGYTYHYMVESFDAGNIVVQKAIPIMADETGFSLFHKLIIEGLRSFEEVFREVVDNACPGTPQPKGGSYYSREIPFGGEIDPRWDEVRIDRFIRAMYFPPFKGAITRVNEREHEVSSIAEYRAIIENSPAL